MHIQHISAMRLNTMKLLAQLRILLLDGSVAEVWASTDGQRLLQGLARRGLPVRILIMSQSNPGLGAMINTQLPSESLDAVKPQTKRMEVYFTSVMKDNLF
jgi:hypothetical protein